MEDFKKVILKDKRSTLLIAALINLIFIGLISGIGLLFWIFVIIWIIFWIILFVYPIKFLVNIFIVTITIVFAISLLISFSSRFLFGSNATTTNGIALEPCTATSSNQPEPLASWKSTIYSGPFQSTSPEVNQANNVRSFSYSKIKNKTESNDMYARIEKSDDSYITGAVVQMEVCDANNMATKYHTTKTPGTPAGENTVASTHYFHGANYLHGAGDYRIDIYVKPAGDNWHLIDRLSNITITD